MHTSKQAFTDQCEYAIVGYIDRAIFVIFQIIVTHQEHHNVKLLKNYFPLFYFNSLYQWRY